MRVLVVDEEVPYPLDTGKRIRTYNLIRRMQEKHTITYVCYESDSTTLPGCPNVTLVILPSPVIKQRGLIFYAALAKNLFSLYPYIVDRHYSPLMEQRILSLLGADNYDLVHCEWMPYTRNIKPVMSAYPAVLSAHNIEAQIWGRYLKAEKNPFRKAYIGLQWKKIIAYERKASRKFDVVVAVSEPDRKVFEEEYGCQNTYVVANGVDEGYFSPLPTIERPFSMVFTGSLDWRPNQDGVRYFLEEVFPLIRREISTASVAVVGRRPPEWFIEQYSRIEGVTFAADVPDVRPYIASGALYVVPLRIGGGSRLKILEALAMGKCVLSTTVGAEGLDLKNGEHLMIRDGVQAFATGAIQVLRNPQQYRHLGENGRKLVLEQYTWDAIACAMDAAWLRSVDVSRGRPQVFS